MENKELIIGIDVGLSGGIIAIDKDGEFHWSWIMPTYEEKKDKRTLDLNELRNIFLEVAYSVKKVYVEKVSAMPGQGVSSMFTFGRTYGAIEAVVSMFELPYELVTPQEWTKVMHKGMDKKMKPKDRSLAVFKRSYPGLDFRPTKRSKKHHEGLIDALLIAEYGRRNLC